MLALIPIEIGPLATSQAAISVIIIIKFTRSLEIVRTELIPHDINP